jgi:hypothetical protein
MGEHAALSEFYQQVYSAAGLLVRQQWRASVILLVVCVAGFHSPIPGFVC